MRLAISPVFVRRARRGVPLVLSYVHVGFVGARCPLYVPVRIMHVSMCIFCSLPCLRRGGGGGGLDSACESHLDVRYRVRPCVTNEVGMHHVPVRC